MPAPSLPNPLRKIPWYWAPYIIALGARDGWIEASARTYKEVLQTSMSAVTCQRQKLFRQASSCILLLALSLLITQRVLAPWLAAGGVSASGSSLLWGSMLIATSATAFMVGWVLRRTHRRLHALYTRGLRVLERRALAATQAL